jgi:hypothetical protein
MYRGMRADEHVRPHLVVLCKEKLRLHRGALLELAARARLRPAA